MTTLNPGLPRTLTASFFTADGKAARVDGAPLWSVSDPTVLELVPTSSEFSMKVRAIGPGTAEVVVEADADLGEGYQAVMASAVFNVPDIQATGGEIVVGEEEVPPTPEPTAEPVPEPTPEPVVVDAAPVETKPEEIPGPVVEELKPDVPLETPPPEGERPTE